ncbi:FAD-binding protein [Metamycoplasma phocicerebrale]|uniref:FAD-binding protein n=1 Tax=Metamycoplasma phocicerebrale TaxID=142649 RepID=A0A3Q9V9Y1_9BACT|nr:FAD-dependent oxidoreductase [Metamycoplasma phocicerebrale]AZZ65252.1 FAD-binding protein [Metamycoplasma phocicerebrale]
MQNKYDVLIIGGGPAGLTAAIYLSRNNFNVAFVEGYAPGGKMVLQSKIENYPGFEYVSGIDLSLKMLNQATKNGAKQIFGNVINIESLKENEKKITLENGEEYFASTVVIATGMKNLVPLDVENIEEFNKKGVSYCAICDGALYKDQPCAIIGGGNSAFEESTYLASTASEVHIFVRDGIIAEAKLVEDAKKNKNIFIHENSVIKKLIGEDKLESIIVDINGKVQEMNIKCVFPYIGFKPSTSFISNKNILNNKGFIIVDKNMETKEKNIFAIGDVIAKDIRQITTATNDGTVVAKTISSRIKK